MKKMAAVLTLLLAALALAACGGSSETTPAPAETGATTEAEGAAGETEAEGEGGGGGGGGDGGTVAIEADPSGSLAFTSEEASAAAGEVSVEFTNESPVGHDVDVEDSEGNVVLETDVITESSESASAELEPGEYTFYCSVAGHREAGMEGTLVVE